MVRGDGKSVRPLHDPLVSTQRGLWAATKVVKNDIAPVRFPGGYRPETPSRRQRHGVFSSPPPVADTRDYQRIRPPPFRGSDAYVVLRRGPCRVPFQSGRASERLRGIRREPE